MTTPDQNPGALRAAEPVNWYGGPVEDPVEGFDDPRPRLKPVIVVQVSFPIPRPRMYIIGNRHKDFIRAVLNTRHYDFLIPEGYANIQIRDNTVRDHYGHSVFELPVREIPNRYKLMEFLCDLRLTYPIPIVLMTLNFMSPKEHACGFLTMTDTVRRRNDGLFYMWINREMDENAVADSDSVLHFINGCSTSIADVHESFHLDPTFVSKIHYDPKELLL